MSGDAALGAASSSSAPSSSGLVDNMMPSSTAPASEPAAKPAPPSAAEEFPPPTENGEPVDNIIQAPQPTAEDSATDTEDTEPAPVTVAAAPTAEPASVIPTKEAPPTAASTVLESSEYAALEALPQPQAPPVAPPTYESEEIIISATDAPAIITTTTAPPTMTSALAPSVSSLVNPATTSQSPSELPTAIEAATPAATTVAESTAAVIAAPTLATAPTIVVPTTPLALHPVRSSGPGGPPLGSNPKHSKLAAKAVPSEKPVEATVAENNPSAKKPLTLLELPVDILRLIVKEITHTNDLTSLALANSTLYNLAVPHIYSRFDIVWPDPSAPPSEGKSVDALTYGLSTLCLGSAFARTAHRLRNDLRRRGLSSASAGNSGSSSSSSRQHTKFGSPNYAKYTRKFSLGNGPKDWVAEYMINKESGKMLGTLVALCVAKMQNLENFVWDMPTGVVSDVFMALASLPDFDPEHDECKLDRLWIRWHNNTLPTPPVSPSSSPSLAPAPPQLFVPQGSNLTPIGIMLPPHSGHPQPRPTIPYSSSHVEFPTFSVVPPLRNLTVLDIDEIAYLDELAVLIERSRCRLNELRIGIASHATIKDFVQTWDGSNLQQVDLEANWPGESTIGDRRLGGVLGILVGRIYDIRRKTTPKNQFASVNTSASAATHAENETNGTAANGDDGETTPVAPTSTENALASSLPQAAGTSASSSAPPVEPPVPDTTPAAEEVDVSSGNINGSHARDDSADLDEDMDDTDAHNRLDKKLRLTTLELERVPLSMQVLVRAIDWSTVTTLTILSCPQHESLWRQLKKHFRPTPIVDHGYGIAPSSSAPVPTSSFSSAPALHYHMALKSIHTDIVSKALLSFIRDTLAPNSLEVLFLQNRRLSDASPHVSIQDIFKNAIKPHRASLTKLLIDGNLRAETDHLEGTRRRRIWTLTTEILNFITSGRMSKLRELAFSLHYRDWHTFLQRLPSLTQLRSLHIQHITDHVVEPLSLYDLAMQIADIVTLRPEVQLCFVGIGAKCYEVVESRGSDNANSADADGLGGGNGGSVEGSINGGTDTSSSTSDDDDDDDDDDDEDSDDDGAGGGDHHHHHHNHGIGVVNGGGAGVSDGSNATGTNTNGHHHNDSDGDDSDSGDSDDDSLLLDGETPAPRPPRLRMREIFFYDDKVAIFKARHGRL